VTQVQLGLPLAVIGSGEYQPMRVLDSTQFDRRFGRRRGWTERQLGVASRRFVGEGETSSMMGATAALKALAAARLAPHEVDCIISACAVMEQPIPCLAAQIQRQLGLGDSGIAAFDVNATCLGFLVALDMAACAFAAGRWRRALIVSSEIASAGLNPDDEATAPLFGDGAAAVVVEARPDAPSRLLAAQLETYGNGSELCQLRAGGTRLSPHVDLDGFWAGSYFQMDGLALYRRAADMFPAFFARLLGKAGIAIDEIAWVIPHQASGRAIDHVVRLLGLPATRTVRILHDHGNQIAASLPVALHHALSQLPVARGDCLLLLGTGAGLALGGVVLRY